ncbi:MAG TPA: nitrate- and nitrite sensing domain-containing protein, partial [Rugosimonospora sp.]|nr:nitrate- and nitrite sensing domain-containing protein [Rugosimonospora sp.]
MIVPTIATIVIGFGALVSNIGGASDAATVQSVASLNERIGALTDALQGERAAANTVLGDVRANPDIQADEVTRYKSLINVSKPIVEAYRTQRATLPDVGPALTAALNQAEEGLASLDSIRAKTTARSATQDSVIQWYNSIITSLQAVRQAGSLLAGDSQLSQAMQIANAVSAYKEAHAVERIKVDDALFTGRATAAQIYNVLAAVAEQATALSAIEPLAQGTDDWDYFKKVINDGTTNFISSAEAQAFQALDPSVGLNVQRSNWDEVVDTHIAKIREAEQYFDDKVSTEARVLHSNRQRSVLVEAALLLGLVLVAVLIAWLMARAMNRSLRELRHGALAIAQYGLPQAVARLRDPSLNTALSPHQVAQQIADPLPVRSRDEFGQVTEAFNAVHLEAVRTAAEQAALRASVATMFVNLARRSQILVDRLIGHLDRLERGEEDPDRLAELFQLDHLATRMRRNDENLLVLAGADSTRVQREPAALIDVLRAAQSEVEHYTRIEFGVIDRDIEIAAHAVNDLVHLVAELFDNATAFSPPDSTVVVEARRVGDRAVLYVEDHGIGISPDQLADLNERLATPPMVDVAVSRMMGLVVVARLAVRHGVKVELRPAHERGTIADVLLPTAVLVPRALAGRGPAAGMPTGQPEAGRGAYPPGSPLALESGPVGPVSPVSPAVGGEIPVGGFGTPFDPAAHGPAAGRNLPSWSDLTGAAGPVVPGGRTPHNGSDSYPGVNGAGPYGGAPHSGAPHSGAPHGGPGLPIRRPGENEPAPTLGNGSEIPGSRPQVPRQTAAS